MLEEQVRQEVTRLLNSCGLETYHPPDIKKTRIARPDIYSMNPEARGSFVIEVKTFEQPKLKQPWFDVTEISDGQRKWLDYWLRRGGVGFLALGTVQMPRKLFIIPWSAWVLFENRLIDVRVELSTIQEMFPEYECEWQTLKDTHFPNSNWVLPKYHPIGLYQGLPFTKKDWEPLSKRYGEKSKRRSKE